MQGLDACVGRWHACEDLHGSMAALQQDTSQIASVQTTVGMPWSSSAAETLKGWVISGTGEHVLCCKRVR